MTDFHQEGPNTTLRIPSAARTHDDLRVDLFLLNKKPQDFTDDLLTLDAKDRTIILTCTHRTNEQIKNT